MLIATAARLKPRVIIALNRKLSGYTPVASAEVSVKAEGNIRAISGIMPKNVNAQNTAPTPTRTMGIFFIKEENSVSMDIKNIPYSHCAAASPYSPPTMELSQYISVITRVMTKLSA